MQLTDSADVDLTKFDCVIASLSYNVVLCKHSFCLQFVYT